MPNLPQESNLIWSTERPSFEDVERKNVYFEFSENNPKEIFRAARRIMTKGDFAYVFNSLFLRYAIIHVELEVLAYKGMKPEINVGDGYCQCYWDDGNKSEETHIFLAPTRSDVITIWNNFVGKMEG